MNIEKQDCAFWRAGQCNACTNKCRYSKEEPKAVVSHLDAGMNRKYKRCEMCKIPMHKDKHEKPIWCMFHECPHCEHVTDPRPAPQFAGVIIHAGNTQGE